MWIHVREKGEIKSVIKGGGLFAIPERRSQIPTKLNNTDGRGGARPGAEKKKSAVKDKAENGNPGGRKLEVLNIPEVEGA